MANEMTADDAGFRSRFRSATHVRRTSSYQQRSQDAFVISDIRSGENVRLKSLQKPDNTIDHLIVYPEPDDAPQLYLGTFEVAQPEPIPEISVRKAFEFQRPRRQSDWLRNSSADRGTDPNQAQHIQPEVLQQRITGRFQQQFQNNQQPSDQQPKKSRIRFSQSQVLMAMAASVFIIGVGVSLIQFKAARQVSAQALSVSQHIDKATAVASSDGQPSTNDTPSTTPVTPKAVNAYSVAPDLPRYITISRINVHARVLQVGVTTDGSLATPSNVYDTAWYTGSA